MATLCGWITDAAGDEPIEGVVIGAMGWGGDYGSEGIPDYDLIPKDALLSWDEAQKYLRYEFSDGFGAPGCNAITVWTATKVMAISQYDGSTSLFWLPRHPINHTPEMPGG